MNLILIARAVLAEYTAGRKNKEDAEDAKPVQLDKHDAKYHRDGYKPGDECKLRESLTKKDDVVETSEPRALTDGWVAVEECDITKQDTDAIVNAANQWMLGGGGVDGAIHRAAGPALYEECAKYPPDKNGYRVLTGEAKITGAGNLKAKHVIHTPGPDVRSFVDFSADIPKDRFGKPAALPDWDLVSEEDKKECARLLGNSYRNSLQLAKDNGCKSVAFPSLSTGIFGYPVDEAAKVAAKEIAEFCSKNPEMKVKMCIFDPNPAKSEAIKKAYENAFKAEEGKTKKAPSDVADEAKELSNLRRLLMAKRISSADFKAGVALLAATGIIPQGQVKAIQADAKDESAEGGDNDNTNGNDANEKSVDLQKHDAKYHPNGYKPGDACKYRDSLASGDNVDTLNPEDVDGEEVAQTSGDGSKQPPNLSALQSDIDADIANIGGVSLSSLKQKIDDYDKAYSAATSGAAVGILQGLANKLSNKSGVMAAIYNHAINNLKSAASQKLPQGTKSPQDIRNEAGLAIAKMLGANLEIPMQNASATTTQSPQSAATQKPTSQSDTPVVAPANASTTPAAPTPTTPTTQHQLGPKPELDHVFSMLPAGMNLDDFATWPRGGGSTGLRIYTDPITKKRYGVKKSGGMPGGVNISDTVMAEDWIADQAFRIAGLNAPDGTIRKHKGSVFKITEWSENTQPLGSGSAATKGQLAEAYPLVALLYNIDASQNGDNIRVDGNNNLLFVDNGSSLGNRAQGGTNSWYINRDNADSTKSKYGVAQLAQHNDQSLWSKALGIAGVTGSYGKTVPSLTQDFILKEAAKYDMGKIARKIDNLAKLNVPYYDAIKYQNLIKWADSLDALSAKYKTNQQPSQPTTTGATSSSPTAQPSTQTSAQSSAQSVGQVATTLGHQISVSGIVVNKTWTSGRGLALFNAMTNATGLSPYAVQALRNMFHVGTLTPNSRGIGGEVKNISISSRGRYVLQREFNTAFAPLGLSLQIHNGGNSVTIRSTSKNIAKQALNATGASPSQPTPTAASQTPSAPASAPQGAATQVPTTPSQTQTAQPAMPAQPQPGPHGFTGKDVQTRLVGMKTHRSWQGWPPKIQRKSTTIQNAVLNMTGLSAAAVDALVDIFTKGFFTPNQRGVGGTVSGLSIPTTGIQALQKNLNTALLSQGLKIQIHNGGKSCTIGSSAKAIAQQALKAAGITPSAPSAQPQPTNQSSSQATPPAGVSAGSTAAQQSAAQQQPSSAQPTTVAQPPQVTQAGTGNRRTAFINNTIANTKSQSVSTAYQSISGWLKQNGL